VTNCESGLPLSEIARDLTGRPYDALALLTSAKCADGTLDLLRSRLSALSVKGEIAVTVTGGEIQVDPPALVLSVSASPKR